MGTPATAHAYSSFLDFVMEKATPADILAYQMPKAEQQRIIELLDKQDEDALTPEEVDELQEIKMVDRMLLALKARALDALE
jgi:uncharacterized protein YciU (UPF0263 family)